MPDRPERFDAVVVGAGASGLWSAIELAGDHEVLVLEAGAVGAGASGNAAGFVSAFPDWAKYPAAVCHSMSKFRALDDHHGFTFDERPYVELAETTADAETLRETYSPLFDRPGYDIEYLDAAELAARWPGRFDLAGFDGGLVNGESGIVDAGGYLDALAARARARGVTLRTQTPVERLVQDGSSISHVETAAGRVEADAVVCTTGAGTAPLVEPFVGFPTREFVYTNVRVETARSLDESYPMLYADDVWWRPEPGCPETFLVSGGAHFLSAGGDPPERPPTAFLRAIGRVLEATANDIATARVVPGSYHTCAKGCLTTPDGLPVVDTPPEGPDGLVVATAVTAGISMSPFIGAAVRALVTGESAPVALDPFSADRFEDAPADFAVDGIREPPAEYRTDEY